MLSERLHQLHDMNQREPSAWREVYEVARDFIVISLFALVVLAVAGIACGYHNGIFQ